MVKDIIDSAFSSTKEGFVGEWMKWILLIVCTFIQLITLGIVPVLNGYIVRVFSGNNTAPEVNQWGKLFIDGWKYNIVAILYMIPAIIIAVVLGFFAILPATMGFFTTGNTDEIMAIIGTLLTGVLLTFVVILLLTLFMYMGLVRLGKTGSIGEAFNFGAINKQINEGVGWLGYIGYFILLWFIAVIYVVIISLLSLIPYVGLIFAIILTPLLAVFIAYYMKNIYEASSKA